MNWGENMEHYETNMQYARVFDGKINITNNPQSTIMN